MVSPTPSSPLPPPLKRKPSPPPSALGDFSGVRRALTALLDLSVAALPPPAPARAFIYAGVEVPWDDCCSGQIWARLLGVEADANGLARPGACGPLSWTARLTLGVLRCAHTVSETGAPPLPSGMTWDAARQVEDAAALEQVLRCSYPETSRPLALTVTGWEPLGVLGGCAGGEWSFTARLLPCPCPP